MDGARQIVIPATVSLLCICIVFVPMFNLGGVAGYLFRPMAEGGRVRARRLVRALAHARQYDGALPAGSSGGAWPRRASTADAQSVQPFPARIRTPVRGRARRSIGVCSSPPWPAARAIRRRLPGRGRLPRSALAPFLGQNFFPPVANTQLKLHVRAPTGTRIEDTALICDGVEAAIRRIVPAGALGPIVDNIGLPVSGINSTYNNSGTVGPADADILITIKPEYASEADELRREDARDPAEIVSGHDLRVPSRRHRLADPQFRPSRADRRSDRRLQIRRQPRLRQQTVAARSRASPASRTRASNKRRTIRRLTSTSTACARRKSA